MTNAVNSASDFTGRGASVAHRKVETQSSQLSWLSQDDSKMTLGEVGYEIGVVQVVPYEAIHSYKDHASRRGNEAEARR
jgi:hypothetical protein